MIKGMYSFMRHRGRTGKKAGVVVVCLCVAMCGLHLLEPKNTHTEVYVWHTGFHSVPLGESA